MALFLQTQLLLWFHIPPRMVPIFPSVTLSTCSNFVNGKDSRFLPKIISIISLMNTAQQKKKFPDPSLIQSYELYRTL